MDFLQSPVYVINPFNGGISGHGGILGVLISFICIFGVKNFSFVDKLVIPIIVWAMFVRLGNIANNELYGFMDCFGEISIPIIEILIFSITLLIVYHNKEKKYFPLGFSLFVVYGSRILLDSIKYLSLSGLFSYQYLNFIYFILGFYILLFRKYLKN